jgi:hypothetical protein
VTLIFLLLSIAAFTTYFYVIWLWYVWFIPLLVFLITIIYYLSWLSFKSRANNVFQDYGLFMAWIVILLGLFLVLKFFGISIISSFLFIIWLNLLVRIWSYIFKYNDGKIIAQVWYYSGIIWLLLNVWMFNWFDTFFIVFSHILVLSLAIISFIVFLVWIRYKIEEYINYKLLIFLLGAIWLSAYHRIENIYIFLIISVVWLGIIYIYLYKILSNKPPTDNQVKEISVRRILAWERVLKSVSHNSDWSKKIYSFVYNFPKFVKYFLEWTNTLIIIVLIYLYFQNALTLQWNIEQIFYWLVMIWFIVNVFLLKRINYTSIFQRLLTFMVINFAIYISLFSALKWNIGSVVFLWILRNIVSTMMVFHIHKTKLWIYLRKIDYLFWIFTTMLALVVNIILLFHTDLVWQLLFPIILLYVWIQGMMFYYSIKYINKIKEVFVDEII